MRIKKEKNEYLESEIANAATHGVGILLGLIGIPLLIYYAALREDTHYLWSAIIYGTTYLMVFTSSTLYHANWHTPHKSLLGILDHIAIYFLIAGTYTPFLMIYLNSGIGGWVLYGLWVVVLIGLIFKLFFTGRFNFVSTLVYLAMGWSIILVFKSFLALVPLPAIVWTGIGGAFYTIGAIIYLQDHIPYNHLAWHFFVLGGAISHFVAVFYVVLI